MSGLGPFHAVCRVRRRSELKSIVPPSSSGRQSGRRFRSEAATRRASSTPRGVSAESCQPPTMFSTWCVASGWVTMYTLRIVLRLTWHTRRTGAGVTRPPPVQPAETGPCTPTCGAQFGTSPCGRRNLSPCRTPHPLPGPVAVPDRCRVVVLQTVRFSPCPNCMCPHRQVHSTLRKRTVSVSQTGERRLLLRCSLARQGIPCDTAQPVRGHEAGRNHGVQPGVGQDVQRRLQHRCIRSWRGPIRRLQVKLRRVQVCVLGHLYAVRQRYSEI